MKIPGMNKKTTGLIFNLKTNKITMTITKLWISVIKFLNIETRMNIIGDTLIVFNIEEYETKIRGLSIMEVAIKLQNTDPIAK